MRALVFCTPIRLPGISGASTELVAGKSDGLHRNALFVDSIVEYKDDFVVDGTWFVPRSAILARKY